MADKITLDFENNIITWDMENQQGTEHCPDLYQKKQAILDSMGFQTVNVSPVINALEDYLNGEISIEEMKETFEAWEE